MDLSKVNSINTEEWGKQSLNGQKLKKREKPNPMYFIFTLLTPKTYLIVNIFFLDFHF